MFSRARNYLASEPKGLGLTEITFRKIILDLNSTLNWIINVDNEETESTLTKIVKDYKRKIKDIDLSDARTILRVIEKTDKNPFVNTKGVNTLCITDARVCAASVKLIQLQLQKTKIAYRQFRVSHDIQESNYYAYRLEFEVQLYLHMILRLLNASDITTSKKYIEGIMLYNVFDDSGDCYEGNFE